MVISAGEWYKSRDVFPFLFLNSLPSLVPYDLIGNRNFLIRNFCIRNSVLIRSYILRFNRLQLQCLFNWLSFPVGKLYAVCCVLQSLGHISRFCSHSKWITTLSQWVSESWECVLIGGYFPFVFRYCSYQKDKDVALKLNLAFMLWFKSEVIFMWILMSDICAFFISYFHGTWHCWYSKCSFIAFTVMNYFRPLISHIFLYRCKFPLFLSWKRRVLFFFTIFYISLMILFISTTVNHSSP